MLIFFRKVVNGSSYDFLACRVWMTISSVEKGLNISVLQAAKRVDKVDVIFLEVGLQLNSNFVFGFDKVSVEFISGRVMHFVAKYGFFGRLQNNDKVDMIT